MSLPRTQWDKSQLVPWADNQSIWAFQCLLLWHHASGMAMTFQVMGSEDEILGAQGMDATSFVRSNTTQVSRLSSSKCSYWRALAAYWFTSPTPLPHVVTYKCVGDLAQIGFYCPTESQLVTTGENFQANPESSRNRLAKRLEGIQARQ